VSAGVVPWRKSCPELYRHTGSAPDWRAASPSSGHPSARDFEPVIIHVRGDNQLFGTEAVEDQTFP